VEFNMPPLPKALENPVNRALSTVPSPEFAPRHDSLIAAVRPVLLAVDADPSAPEHWKQIFGQRFEVRHVTPEQAFTACDTAPYDVVLVDVRGAESPALVSGVRQRQPQAAVLALGAVDRPDAAVAALSTGATDFLLKPLPHAEEARVRVEGALVRRRAGADAELLATPYSAARAALIKNFDVRYLQGLMRATRGNISEASRRSGIDRANLRRMLKHHGISPVDFGAVRTSRSVASV
jgi:DNA-binding NtrC family response regulator